MDEKLVGGWRRGERGEMEGDDGAGGDEGRLHRCGGG